MGKKYLWVELLGHMVLYKKIPGAFQSCTILHTHQQLNNISCSTFLPTFGIVSLFNISHSNSLGSGVLLWFSYVFLWFLMMLSTCLLPVCILFFFGKVFICPLPIKKIGFVFSLLWNYEFFVYLVQLKDKSIIYISSQSVTCLLIFFKWCLLMCRSF